MRSDAGGGEGVCRTNRMQRKRVVSGEKRKIGIVVEEGVSVDGPKR